MSVVSSTGEPAGLSRIPFTVAAEKQIKSLSFWLKIVGWLNAFAAGSDILNIVIQWNLSQLANLVLHAAVATWTLQASQAFNKVATTDVADQAFLVQGFAKLRSVFLLQGLLVLVALAFVSAALLFLVLHGV